MARLLALLLATWLPTVALGQDLTPDELVRRVTTEVLEAIRADPDLQAGDRRKMLELAERKVLPHVDFRDAVQLAVGPGWARATPEQRRRLADEFRSMLIRIYSSAIGAYRGQAMQVLPLSAPPGAIEVTVRNRFLRPGAAPVPVEYQMRRGPEGWKIYDVSIAGVSLVLTYRAEFAQLVRTAGIEGLLERLAAKHR
jgi:phospholipid transport system substrate-binding protein